MGHWQKEVPAKSGQYWTATRGGLNSGIRNVLYDKTGKLFALSSLLIALSCCAGVNLLARMKREMDEVEDQDEEDGGVSHEIPDTDFNRELRAEALKLLKK